MIINTNMKESIKTIICSLLTAMVPMALLRATKKNDSGQSQIPMTIVGSRGLC